MSENKHWTSRDNDSFKFAVLADFIDQVKDKLEKDGISIATFFKKLHDPHYIALNFDNPDGLSVLNMADIIQALNLKMTILVYDDGDTENKTGPVNSEMFKTCWDLQGKPTTWG